MLDVGTGAYSPIHSLTHSLTHLLTYLLTYSLTHSGTGILAFFAIQAGAKHVYAVEASDSCKTAQILVDANGYSDRITILNGKIEEITGKYSIHSLTHLFIHLFIEL